MLIGGSRINRWTETEQTRRAPEPLLRATQAGSDVVERAEAALELALSAVGAAHEELQRYHAHLRKVAALEVATGAIGLAGLATTALVGASEMQSALVCLFAIAGAVPIGTSVWRASLGRLRESDIVAAIENARAVAQSAASLRAAAVGLPTAEVDRPGTKALIDAILTHVEQSAAVSPGREQRGRGSSGEQSRRHVRIKPFQDRVVVTRDDGVGILGRLVDVSLSGAAVSGDLPDVAAGDHVLVGSKAARVVRVLPHGIACEFVKTLPPAQLDFDIVL